MKKEMIGYQEALEKTLDNISPLPDEMLPLAKCTNRVIARDIRALVNSPSVNASLKDGYAVRSNEISAATRENPVHLKLLGLAAPGNPFNGAVAPETAVQILTGGQVPEGADAVVSDEFAGDDGQMVVVYKDAMPGKNILPMGSDVKRGAVVASAGMMLSPGWLGFLAAAGYGQIPVYQVPSVSIIATGDEVVAPGQPLPEGKLYASNLVTVNAWCQRYGMTTAVDIVGDDPDFIRGKLKQAIENHDAVLTSGGAWTGDKDFVERMLEELGWKKVFHFVRLGPGKGVGFGLCQGKLIFVLPGGPPSNLAAFLEIALPGLLKLGGHRSPSLPEITARLNESLSGQIDWTQCIFGKIETIQGRQVFKSLKIASSRLQSMASADGIVVIPEGTEHMASGSEVPVQLLI